MQAQLINIKKKPTDLTLLVTGNNKNERRETQGETVHGTAQGKLMSEDANIMAFKFLKPKIVSILRFSSINPANDLEAFYCVLLYFYLLKTWMSLFPLAVRQH